MFLKNAWYAAGFSGDLAAGQLLQRWILGEPIVLFRRTDGTPAALEDRCAHRGAPLSCGRIEGDAVRCMYHGLKYEPGGKCIEIPGQPRITESMKVRSYPVQEISGWLWVWAGDPAKADPALVPAAIGFDDPEWDVGGNYMDYQANYVLINDNLCDFSHLAFVHVQSFGGGNENAMKIFSTTKPDVTKLERGIRVKRWICNAPATKPSELAQGKQVDSLLAYDYLAPGVLLMMNASYPAGTAQACDFSIPTLDPLYADFTSQAVVPLTATTSRYYYTWGPRRRDVLPGMKEGMLALAFQAFTEDRVMIEAQQRIHDATPDLKMNPIVHDRGPSQMRWVMEKLMKAEREPAADVAA